MPAPPKVAPSRQAIEASHSFPGAYVFKAFGPAEGPFAADILACARRFAEPARVAVSHRRSGSGRRVCVTVTLQARDADEVIGLYHRLAAIDGLLMLL